MTMRIPTGGVFFAIREGSYVKVYREMTSPDLDWYKLVQQGRAPRGVGRTDIGKVRGEQQHMIIVGAGAINIDGTWKARRWGID